MSDYLQESRAVAEKPRDATVNFVSITAWFSLRVHATYSTALVLLIGLGLSPARGITLLESKIP